MQKQAINLPIWIILITIVLFTLANPAFAISAEQATALVTIQNNYLLPNESASVSKGLINYKGEAYIVVAAVQSDGKINAYIPIKNTSGEIAAQDLEIREVIKTTIIYTKMNQLNQTIAAANWPFSYSTKSYFYDLKNNFETLFNSTITVQTELKKFDDTQSKALVLTAGEVQTMLEEIAQESTTLTEEIEKARVFETEFFNTPDTNKKQKYEDYYNTYFSEMETMKENFNALDMKLSELIQGIGALENVQITIDQKRSFQALLATPINARRLPSVFSQTNELRTQIEGIFNEAKNSEGYATTLAARKMRSEAWKIIYGRNEELIKLDNSFETLQKASEAILSEDNVDLWVNQDAVAALKTNWSNAKSRFDNAEYEKSKDYATNAQKNIKLIMGDGVTQIKDNSQELVTQVIIGLVILVIVIFVLEKFVLKKAKKEDYDEPEYK